MSQLNIKQCRLCSKPFQSLGTVLCQDCAAALDEEFVKVREYLYTHEDNSDIADIVEHTGVPEKHVFYLIKEGRLETKSHASALAKCSNCGTAISSGRLCIKCQSLLNKMASPASGQNKGTQPVHNSGVRMHGRRDK